jgi:adenosylcobinamide-GDP ribazoletransferase
MSELRIFFTALMFFTRIPCPAWVDHSEEYLNKSSRYFPLMGWIVGGVGAAVLLLAVWGLRLPVFAAVLLSTVATILTTGAFHEDGFGDMCDGFGGGWTKERILDIMQDSRLGTFGAVGLALLLAMKVACLAEIGAMRSLWFVAATLLAGHALSRFVAVTFLITHEYARADGENKSKSKPLATRMSAGEFAIAALTGLAPLALMGLWESWFVVLVLLPLAAVKWWLGRFFTRWIGGYTGDCLGATQQVSEVVYYMTIVCFINWRIM